MTTVQQARMLIFPHFDFSAFPNVNKFFNKIRDTFQKIRVKFERSFAKILEELKKILRYFDKKPTNVGTILKNSETSSIKF